MNSATWYVLYKNIDDPRFTRGSYIMKIKISEGYPFVAPKFIWITPNGRFEVNMEICYSISTLHPEEWSPLWNLNAIIIGILSMFLDINTIGIGHIGSLTNPVPLPTFKKYADESCEFNKKFCAEYKITFPSLLSAAL